MNLNKEKLKELWRDYNHLTILLYYGVIYLLYNTFNGFIEPEYMMHSIIDDYIPFLEIFVIPYLLWYVYIGLAVVFFAFKSREHFIKMMLFMFSGMTICFLIYYLFPNGQQLRPDIQVDGPLSWMIASIYGTDKPTNVAPSMHVLDSIAIHVAVVKSRLFEDKKWVEYTSLISAFLISVSTVFIKQHSIVDGIYAVLLSFVLYKIIYRSEEESLVKEKREAGLLKNKNI